MGNRSMCSVEGCQKPHSANGFCSMHNSRLWRNGSLETIQKLTPLERLKAKIEVVGECWEWQGVRLDAGYGVISIDGQKWLCHRLMYSLEHGEIPEGMLVCHTCDNPPCIRPSHLFLGTPLDNMQDMMGKGRRIIPNRPHGVDNHKAKLTESDVLKIRSLYSTGIPSRKLGQQFGVTKTNILDIVNCRTWKHL